MSTTGGTNRLQDWQPGQATPQPVCDFRGAPVGPKGYKERRKRKLDDYAMKVEQEAAQMQDDIVTPVVELESVKRAKHDITGIGKVSKRQWKLVGEPAHTLKDDRLRTSWEKKMALKAQQKNFLDHKEQVSTARKEKMAAVKAQREAAKKRKEENRKKSVVGQVVTNTAKLRKIMKSKKERKKLMTVDTS